MRAAFILILTSILITACMKPDKVEQKKAKPDVKKSVVDEAAGKTVPAAASFQVRISSTAEGSTPVDKIVDVEKESSATVELGETVCDVIFSKTDGSIGMDIHGKAEDSKHSMSTSVGIKLSMTIDNATCSVEPLEKTVKPAPAKASEKKVAAQE